VPVIACFRLLVPATALLPSIFPGPAIPGSVLLVVRHSSGACAAELIAGQKVLHKYNIFCSLVIGAVKKFK
jgi:hypothetical protein